MKIRSDILRIYQALHTWTGIGAGMLLFIGFFGGALTMFKQPLERWAATPAPAAAALSPGQLDRLVPQVLAAHPAARREFTLHLGRRADGAPALTWSGAGGGRELDLSAGLWQATLDESGALAARLSAPSQLARLIDLLHRSAGIPGRLAGEYVGEYLMGVAGVLYFLALASGLILLLPTLVKDFFALRPGRNRKRFWLDAHNIVGVTSLPFHLVISLTVIVFVFHDQFYDSLAKVVYGARPMFGAPAQGAKPHPVGAMLPVSTLIARARREAPDFELTELLFIGLESARPRLRAALVNPRHLVRGPVAAYLILDPYSGKVTDTSMLPGQGNGWSAMVAPLFALHFGSYGGDPVRWVYFLFGLSGAFLFYSGNLLWLEKRRKRQRADPAPPRQTRAARLMASASVGVCLGCVAGVCAAMAAGKWFDGAALNVNRVHLAVYYGVFLLALGWSFWRGAARAAVDLLRLCALAALAIPLSALLASAPGLWAERGLASLGVDLVALAAALAFLYGARLTARRGMRGPFDSVWSASAAA